MTESELLMLQTELIGNVWSIIFTWIGTTTAMVGAAYFVAVRIKLSIMLMMLGLYTMFTAACASQLMRYWGRILGVAKDLVALQESGHQLSYSAIIAISNIDSRFVVSVTGPLMLVVFIGSAIYVVYCYKGGGAN
jgi:hypothetical protein